MIQIGISNESTVLTDEQAKAAMSCLQAQVTEDFSPVYGMEAALSWLEKEQKPVPGQWQFVFADNSDQLDDLGYHETTANGDPIGFAFVKDDIADGASWTVTASHEVLEMLGDPDITTVENEYHSDGTMTFRAKEVCDVCEADSLGYTKTGHLLPDGTPFLFSDFVYPLYWNPNAPADSRLDFCGYIKKPLDILSGGYVSILQVPATISWGQVQKDRTLGGKEIKDFNRRARRLIPRELWQRSER